jgi:hypothetical protein
MRRHQRELASVAPGNPYPEPVEPHPSDGNTDNGNTDNGNTTETGDIA